MLALLIVLLLLVVLGILLLSGNKHPRASSDFFQGVNGKYHPHGYHYKIDGKRGDRT